MEQPTNLDLKRLIEDSNEKFIEHEKEDEDQFTAIHSHISNIIEGMATKKDIEDISAKLDPILDAYKAILFSKSFVGGLATIVISISAIGAGFYWLINSMVHK